MFGWDELELETALKRITIIALLLAIPAIVLFLFAVYAGPTGTFIILGSVLVAFGYTPFGLMFVRIIIIPPSSLPLRLSRVLGDYFSKHDLSQAISYYLDLTP